MSDQDLNKLFQAIGELKGQAKGIIAAQTTLQITNEAQWEELSKISETLTNHRIKTAGFSGGIAALVVGLFEGLKFIYKILL